VFTYSGPLEAEEEKKKEEAEAEEEEEAEAEEEEAEKKKSQKSREMRTTAAPLAALPGSRSSACVVHGRWCSVK